MSRVLVVDDEPDMRFILRRIFERAGHEVTDAGDGVAALREAEQARPDLVITDMMMPPSRTPRRSRSWRSVATHT